jgi:hypothetical protein
MKLEIFLWDKRKTTEDREFFFRYTKDDWDFYPLYRIQPKVERFYHTYRRQVKLESLLLDIQNTTEERQFSSDIQNTNNIKHIFYPIKRTQLKIEIFFIQNTAEGEQFSMIYTEYNWRWRVFRYHEDGFKNLNACNQLFLCMVYF